MNKTLNFSYPRRGLVNRFTTFRVGTAPGKKYNPGDKVDLVCSRTKKVLKTVTVEAVHVGPLKEMAEKHAHIAHNWKEHPEAERPGLLLASLRKRCKLYGPERTSDTAPVTVMYMKEDQ